MSTWSKNVIFIRLLANGTGSGDTSAHTVEFQPIDQAYPTGAIAGTQCSGDASVYQPASNLDTEKHYDIYVDAARVGRIFGMDANPSFGA
jgi:hypothetical protein